MARSLALCIFLCALPLGHALAQDCRDATGEPTRCPDPSFASVTLAPSDAPVPAAGQAPEPSDDGEGGVAYAGYELFVEVARPAGLELTQAGPERAPELARSARILGAPEVVIAGLSLMVGARPLPWLRIPELRLTVGGADFAASPVRWGDGAQSMDATLGSMVVLRAELAGGFEVPIDDFSIYATGHIAIAGYFVDATLMHPSAGSLGVATLTEDAWEAGWTVGFTGRLAEGLRLGLAYRHVHTGAESDQVRFTVELGGR